MFVSMPPPTQSIKKNPLSEHISIPGPSEATAGLGEKAGQNKSFFEG